MSKDKPSWEVLPAQTPDNWHTVVLRGILLGLISLALLTVIAVAGGLGIYAYYARTLPSPEELYERQAPFQTTRIYDRHGRLLYEILDPMGGRRSVVSHEDLPQVLVDATLATEDDTFFTNPGVNPLSIARALYANVREGTIVQGGSTITQQVAKNLFLSTEQTFSRKIKEGILAAEITRRYSKEEILQVYLNDVYFGNLAYGIGAASETYFGKEVLDLTLPEAALLAGLIQAPSYYDPYTNPEGALARRTIVLRLMLNHGRITPAQFEEANATPVMLLPRASGGDRLAPHWVDYVRAQLEREFGAETLYRSGFHVYTTLDLDMQRIAEQTAREHIATLQERNARNAALVAMDPHTGEILAMLGSVDFEDVTIDGQVNVTTRLRQPGSTIKTLTYLTAFERGWSPSTMLMDVKQDFPDGANPPYTPRNYDDQEWGPISLRTALGSSRNIPAVSTLHQVGMPALIEMAQRLGIESLTRPDYGLSLTLGGGDVTLLEMTTAYAAIANGGYRVEPRYALHIHDQAGQVIVAPQAPNLVRAIDPRHAYLMSDILSDNEARSRAFGADSALKLSFPAAAKTGTTDDYRDSLTVGYTPRFVTGVWVGNSDNSQMERLTGSRGAAPIWKAFMEQALANQPHPDFERPPGLVEIEVCPVSGERPTAWSPPAVKALFLEEHLPGECSVHRHVDICTVSGQLATENCPHHTVEQRVYEDYGPEWDAWAQERGINIPPRESCTVHLHPAQVEIQAPHESDPMVIAVTGSTEIADFSHYYVEYGQGRDPQVWHRITADISSPVRQGLLVRWDARNLSAGDYSLQLVVIDQRGTRYDARTAIRILEGMQPTLAPTPTETMVPTLTMITATPSPTATFTIEPTLTPTVQPTWTSTPTLPTVTAVPSPTATSVPTEVAVTPTATPAPTEIVSPSSTPTPEVSESTTPEPPEGITPELQEGPPPSSASPS